MSRRRAAASVPPDDGGAERLRVDRWLWHVRAFKTRSLAAARIQAGGVRINGRPCTKPGAMIRLGDIVTFPAGSRVLTYEVVAPGIRRGPATEAATLYRDLSAPVGPDEGDFTDSAP